MADTITFTPISPTGVAVSAYILNYIPPSGGYTRVRHVTPGFRVIWKPTGITEDKIHRVYCQLRENSYRLNTLLLESWLGYHHYRGTFAVTQGSITKTFQSDTSYTKEFEGVIAEVIPDPQGRRGPFIRDFLIYISEGATDVPC